MVLLWLIVMVMVAWVGGGGDAIVACQGGGG